MKNGPLVEVGYPVAEEREEEGSAGEGDLLTLEVAGAAAGHAWDERDAEGEAAEEAAEVGGVVDADADGHDGGAEADDEVERGELDDGAAEALELVDGDGQLVVGEQDDEDAGDAEDGS